MIMQNLIILESPELILSPKSCNEKKAKLLHFIFDSIIKKKCPSILP